MICLEWLNFLVLSSLLCFSWAITGPETCRLRLPPPMDIDKFNSKVADGEDWVELLFLECPLSSTEAEVTQFRVKYFFEGGQLNRTRNFRIAGECDGIQSSIFTQVGTTKAAFESTNSQNVTREDRFFSPCVDDYLIWVVCRDVSDLNPSRTSCNGPYFVSVLIRQDPPTNFPWDRLIWELRKFARSFRQYIFSYVGEVCPVD